MVKNKETALNGSNDQIRRIQSVLRDFRPLLDRLNDERREMASRFNVVEALGVTRAESAHSQFIAYLLNPAGRHDQGDFFLASLLQCLGLDFCPVSTRGASVSREFSLGDYGRADIHIRLANGQIILLENKVDDVEGDCQLGRYQKWLERHDGPPGFLHQLVILTPEGRAPASACSPEDVTCLSYVQVADWLSAGLQGIEAQRLRIILEQYAETCRHIGNPTRRNTMPDEIRQFFLDLDDDRLEAALKMAPCLEEFRKTVYETFCRDIGQWLTRKLEDNGHAQLWEVKFDQPLIVMWGGFEIAWKNGDRHFRVRLESSWGHDKNFPLFFGIARGPGLARRNLADEDRNLEDRLVAQGFRRDSNWPGFRLFHSSGLPLLFEISDSKDVLAVRDDLRKEGSPLTHQVADLVWDLFVEYHQELEELNNNYPYR